jgi:hypothetical protein
MERGWEGCLGWEGETKPERVEIPGDADDGSVMGQLEGASP